MKPDGVTMENTDQGDEPSSSSQENVAEQPQAQPEQVPPKPEEPAKAPAAKFLPKAAIKPMTSSAKPKPQPQASATSRPGSAAQRPVNGSRSNGVSAGRTTTTGAAAPAAGAVPKRRVGGAAAGPTTTAQSQARAADRRPAGAARATSVTAPNGTRAAPVNGTAKKRPDEARTKANPTTSRPAHPIPKTSTLTTRVGTATAAGGAPKTRPATGPSTARPASASSRPTTATTTAPGRTKPTTTTTTTTTSSSSSATTRTAAPRGATASSTGRTTAAQTSRPAAVRKDVGRPPATGGLAKKPAPSAAAAGKPESSKVSAVPKVPPAKAADSKVLQSRTQPPARSTTLKKPASAGLNRPLSGQTPPSSPASRPTVGPQARHPSKPTQAVVPFNASKKTSKPGSLSTRPAAKDAVTEKQKQGASCLPAACEAPPPPFSSEGPTPEEAQGPPPEEAQGPPPEEAQGPTPEEAQGPTPEEAQGLRPDVVQGPTAEEAPQQTAEGSPAAPQSPVRTETPPPREQEEASAPAQPTPPPTPPVACPQEAPREPVYLLLDQTPSTSKASPVVPPINLNEEEDEEEREGSQQVSVSEMSGTTQPTEESRPGSAGLAAGSAWRAGGALFSELDSEDVSGSQQGASEFSAPGVLEGTESMDDLGDGSLKGAIDMEGASAGSPDFEKVPDIPANDFDEDEDDSDRVCDMDVGSERADEPPRPRHDNDVDDEDEDEDEDVDMASEGVTESGLESYGNADEDDFAEDERLDNLNRVAQPPPPPPPLLPAAPAAQWDQPNPFADPWAEPPPQHAHASQPAPEAGAAAAASPLADPWPADSETPTQAPAQAWLELGAAHFPSENIRDEPHSLDPMQNQALAPPSAPGMSLSSTLSSDTSTPEELADYPRDGKFQPEQAGALSEQPGAGRGDGDGEEEEEEEEVETLPADEVLGGPATAPTSNPSSSSETEDEASDTEGEAQLDDGAMDGPNVTFDLQPSERDRLSTVEESEEAESERADATPPSATSLASYGFDTTASNSNAQSTGESCVRSPGIFSLEELPEEAKEPGLLPQPLDLLPQPLDTPQYIECGKQGGAEQAPGPEEAPDLLSVESTMKQPEENPDNSQSPYFSAICDKNSEGFTALPHPHRRDHAASPRAYCDLLKAPPSDLGPRLTCADLPPRSPGQQALSPQLRRLEQHHRQLQELQHRREQQSRPLEEAEQERKRREEEEQRRKKEEAEEEIKRNREKEAEEEEEEKRRRDLELQLQQQQEELKQRQQIMQWQQELQQSNKGQTVLLSPSSGLCTIYEALENSDEDERDEEEEGVRELRSAKAKQARQDETTIDCDRVEEEKQQPPCEAPPPPPPPPLPPHPDSPQAAPDSSQDGDASPPESPERPPPLDLDWGKKVDIVQQLINQTLLLNRDGCSSLLLLPGGAGGTLSPLESSLWPSLLPPLTPPSATVTSVSSFSPEATGSSSPQGEWTVVELETHH